MNGSGGVNGVGGVDGKGDAAINRCLVRGGWQRLAAALGLLLAILGGGGLVAGGESDSRTTAVWVADREGRSLRGLDRDLFVVETRRASWPVGVLAGRSGQLWTLEATEGQPLGDHRLACWDAGGELLWEAETGPVLDLAGDGAGRALVVELGSSPDAPGRLLRAEPAGAADGRGEDLLELLARPGLACAAGEAGLVLAGTATGQLLVLDGEAPFQVVRALEVGGQIGDVAPVGWPGMGGGGLAGGAGPGGPPASQSAQKMASNGWWVLDVATPARLLRLGPQLGLQWEVPTGIRPAHLIPDPQRGSVWAADTNEPFVRRWGSDGSLELSLGDLPLGGLDRGAVLGEGIVLTAPGALLRLDGTGGVLPGQGGFHFPVDLAAVK
ncbi:MAG: hypothetical protein CMJ87_03220 [Planctomycetes bacterium]|nr:hypothetical protein [Planctomycetota bacterium]